MVDDFGFWVIGVGALVTFIIFAILAIRGRWYED